MNNHFVLPSTWVGLGVRSFLEQKKRGKVLNPIKREKFAAPMSSFWMRDTKGKEERKAKQSCRRLVL